MTGENIYEFIKPHLGSIEPSGNHVVDTERMDNIEIYDDLLNYILSDLDQTISIGKDHNLSSINKLSENVKRVLEDKKRLITEILEDL